MARIFRIDPAGLLDDGGDDFRMQVRLAAAQYVVACEAKEAAKAKASAKH